jgi:hypothetical protein
MSDLFKNNILNNSCLNFDCGFVGYGSVQSCRWLTIFRGACLFLPQFQPKHADSRFLQNVGYYVGNRTVISQKVTVLNF